MNKVGRFAISMVIAFAVFFGVRFAMEEWRSGGLPRSPENATMADIEEFVKQPPLPAMFDPIAKHFPEDAAQIKQALLDAIRKRASSDELMLLAQNAVIKMRKSHAHYVLTAPDDHLKRIIGLHLAMYEGLSREPAVCNKAIIEGVPSLTLSQKQQIIEALPNVVAVMMEALAAGKNEPVKRGEQTSDISDRFVRELENKMSEADLRVLFSPQRDIDRTCAAMIDMLKTMHQADFDGADIVRSDFARDLTAN